MSVLEPPPEGDDGMGDLFASLEDVFAKVDEDAVDVTKLGDEELLRQFGDLTSELQERHEVLNPTTDRGREIHSIRGAMSIELRERGLLGQ